MRRSMTGYGYYTDGEALVQGGLCCDLTKARVKVMKNSVNGCRKC